MEEVGALSIRIILGWWWVFVCLLVALLESIVIIIIVIIVLFSITNLFLTLWLTQLPS